MLNTKAFGDELKSLGYDFYSGVPCSFLKYLINYAINDCDYVMASNEGDAIATASGAYLGGRKSVVLMQNSGLTNATSPLISLNYSFRLPVLGFVSLRGEEGLNDEPQHELMGKITTQMLSLMDVAWEILSDTIEEAREQLIRADQYIADHKTFFFVIRKGTFEKVLLDQQKLSTTTLTSKKNRTGTDEKPTRTKALNAIINFKDAETVFLATTGKTGRELFEVEDIPNNLYMVGSMGCVSALGLGLALAKPGKKVIVIDGDGAALMRLGSLPTNAYYHPENMLHILLDNNMHDSTGGQATISHNVDFIENVISSGYPNALYAHNLQELENFIQNWKITGGLTFIYLKIQKGSPSDLGRPTISPSQVKDRLMKFLNKTGDERVVE